MKFSRLRLSGFKSFVEPTELHIERGLTGVVGPNGCGKSNLLEALRWVMGESSYKSMRASGMDDVIFSGTSTRPSRNMAEVVVTMENDDRSAPPQYNGDNTVEISRRIEREAGSAYRINGKDARARDVQLLFADASTGSRSPALVRQGQIGEIISAKPQARRRILEEAAGITGLHTRRHEAELKLNAAETNLTRLDDVVGQLESQLASLKRQARQAIRYKELSGEIRRLEAAGLYMAWKEAVETLTIEQRQLDEVTRLLGGFTKAVSEKTRARNEVGEKLPKLRENETVRAAVLQRLNIEREGLEREETQARARHDELQSRIDQAEADLTRERDILGDTDGVLARLDGEQAELETANGKDGQDRATAATSLQEAADKLAKAQEAADAGNAKLSELTAKRDSIARTIAEQQNRIERMEREVAEVSARRETIMAETGAAENEARLSSSVEAAVQAAAAAEAVAGDAEATVRQKRQAEAEARQSYDEVRRKSESLTTEVRTLTKLLNVTDGDLWPPLIDALKVEPGYETALGAALGDDIDAPADDAAPVHWKALPPLGEAPGLPGRIAPLSKFVEAPAALARRLSHIGVIASQDGEQLQKLLQPGQRLVSLEGDLWRWDGYSAAADAPTAAAKRLAERNRLVSLQHESADAQRNTDSARAVLDEARSAVESAVAAEREKRNEWRTATTSVENARKALSAHEREMSEQLQKASALQEAARRLNDGLSEARGALTAAKTEQSDLPAIDGIETGLANLRALVDQGRAAYADARARHDGLEREARLRAERLKSISAERQQWHERAKKAGGQIEALTARIATLQGELTSLSDLPSKFADRRKKLMNLLSEAERDRTTAADALATAENLARQAESELREAEKHLSETREEHARLGARIEAAVERRQEIETRISEALQCAPEKIVETAGLDGEGIPPKEQIDRKLIDLRDKRERLGGVNLRAEEEAEEVSTQLTGLVTERDDLIGAITKLRGGISSLNKEGRQRLLDAFDKVNESFGDLFAQLFNGGKAELQLIESDDPLEAGLEILAHPPGKRPQVLSLLSGGEQALTALALIFAVFLTNPSPICVLDEVDAPLDDHNVERFCNLLDAMLERTDTRFLIITHHALTMSRMNRLFGVTMQERGVSQLVSVDLETAEALRQAS